MKARTITQGVSWLGAIDWDRRLFDSLIPLPDGTSYNAYLIEGSDKTALLDTVDPDMADVLLTQLADVSRIDYLVSHHAEQDHSGTLPLVLEKFPQAKIVCTAALATPWSCHMCPCTAAPGAWWTIWCQPWWTGAFRLSSSTWP